MASLQVREIPDHLYHKLANEARREHRSIAQEAISLLDRSLGGANDHVARRRILLRKLSEMPPVPDVTRSLDPVDVIREDRKR